MSANRTRTRPSARRPADLGRVGERGQAPRRDDRDTEGRLQIRLVPTGEAHPGVGRLEVGGRDHVRGPLVVVPRAVEADHPIVQRSAETEAEDPLPRRSRLGEPERHPFGPRVQDDLLQVDRGAVRGLEQPSRTSSSFALRTISVTGSCTVTAIASWPSNVAVSRKAPG